MSFSFRDKGRLSDRLRGKTCDEILKELRDHLHQDRSMSFESSPPWGGFSGPAFSRGGFPFLDQEMMPRPDMRAHFEDLANRHPEFADHLRPSAWGTVPEADPHFFQSSASGPEHYRQRHASGSSGSGSGVYSEDNSVPIPVIHEDSGGGSGGSFRSRTRKIPQYGLRNTVDLGESHKLSPSDSNDAEARSQRSWSAPPDNRAQGEASQPKRFVTRVDINNSQANPSTSGANDTSTPVSSGVNSPGKPPPFPKSSGASSPQAQQPSSKQGNVRHIPIFVEGRDEPVLPKTRDSHAYASSHSSAGFGQPNFSYSYAQAAPSASHSSAFASSHASSSPPGHRNQPNQTRDDRAPPPPQASAPPVPNVPPKQSPASKPVNPKDPIARVQAIQDEVNELKGLVEKFSGDRNDKEYIYLDEMLTRNLIKLDDIETEGKENIRLARKEAIRSIQKCISILESKAPLPQETSAAAEECVMDDDKADNCEDLGPETSNVVDENGSCAPEESMGVDEKVASSEHAAPLCAENIVSESTGQDSLSEKPMDIVPDEGLKENIDTDIISSKPPEDQEASISSGQVSENMEVVENQLDAKEKSALEENKDSEDKKLNTETVGDLENSASGTGDAKADSQLVADPTSDVKSAANEQPNSMTENTSVVNEAGKVLGDEVKSTEGVENTSSTEVPSSSKEVTTSVNTDQPNSASTSDDSGEKCGISENINMAEEMKEAPNAERVMQSADTAVSS